MFTSGLSNVAITDSHHTFLWPATCKIQNGDANPQSNIAMPLSNDSLAPADIKHETRWSVELHHGRLYLPLGTA